MMETHNSYRFTEEQFLELLNTIKGNVGRDMEWQPIETAPRDGTYVLLYEPNLDIASGNKTFVGKFGRVKYDSYGSKGVIFEDLSTEPWDWYPTHWMPLPEPPK